MANGMRARQITEYLFISYETLKTHRKNIYKKLDVHTAAGAVVKGLRKGIIK